MDNCYIDGISAWNTYGVCILKGGYGDLLSFPSLKTPESTSWPEEDGIEVELSAPRLEAKEISIPFISVRGGIDANNFIDFISEDGYRALYVPRLGRTFHIRLASEALREAYRNLSTLTLRFAQDMPVQNEAVPNPGLAVRRSVYEMDGTPLDSYGIVVEAARGSVLKTPAAKANLTREIASVDGRIYDTGDLVFEAKEVAFKCHLKAASMQHFWQCYDAFFSMLVKPGERQLYVDYTGETYPCYYKSSSAFRPYFMRQYVLVEFTLALVFIAFRIGRIEYLLATENGDLIVTEDSTEENPVYINTEYGT